MPHVKSSKRDPGDELEGGGRVAQHTATNSDTHTEAHTHTGAGCLPRPARNAEEDQSAANTRVDTELAVGYFVKRIDFANHALQHAFPQPL